MSNDGVEDINSPNSDQKYNELENTIRKATGFGSRVPRFGIFSGHPALETNRFFGDPCKYSPTHDFRKCEIYVKGREPWTYEKNLQDWSRNLGYRNQKILRKRKEQAGVLGPAWHDVKDYPKYEPTCENVGFGRTARLTAESKDCFPGPGTYYKATSFKAPYGSHSTRPSFEREPRCRFKSTVPPWYRGINTYAVVDKDCIEWKPKKLVSRRGPYDLFTGKRDESTIISKYNYRKVNAATWPYLLPGSLETYKKSKFGEFNKTSKYAPYFGRNALSDITLCKHSPDKPSPTDYTPYPEKTVSEGKVAFMSSSFRKYNYDHSKLIWPSVGLYNIADSQIILGDGHKHVFKSKVPRADLFNIQIYNNF